MVAEILGKIDHRNVRIEELEEIPALTPASRTYEPYQHGEFAREPAALADSILGQYGYHCSGEQYIISKDGGRMFGVRSYGHGARAHSVIDYTDSSTQGELKMQFAFANSTDRSLRAKFGLGAKVLVCSNGIVAGEIVVTRKHTPGLREYLVENLTGALHKAPQEFGELCFTVDRWKRYYLSDQMAHRLLGEWWGQGIISPAKLGKIKKHWESDDDFPDKTLWSLYNAVTESYKGLPPNLIFSRHIALHSAAQVRYNNQGSDGAQVRYNNQGSDNENNN